MIPKFNTQIIAVRFVNCGLITAQHHTYIHTYIHTLLTLGGTEVPISHAPEGLTFGTFLVKIIINMLVNG